jgi:SAM-dependent methyltransferase
MQLQQTVKSASVGGRFRSGRQVESMAPDHDYWDAVGADWRTRRPQRLWREFTDRHQLGLIHRWLGTLASGGGDLGGVEASATLLKTDLFDEVSGHGLVRPLLASGVRVTGIDISPVIVAEAAACNPGLDAVAADVRSLPFADGSFTAIFSGSTLDHFGSTPEIRAALVELRRVLRPGGQLVLTMDNPANPLIGLRNGPLLAVLRRIGIVPYQVGATLGPRALAAAVRDAGFEIVEATAVMHCPRALAVPLAGLVDRLPEACRRGFMRCLAACERLESLPTRWLTGHYVAIHAVAREPEVGGPAIRLPAAMP